MRGNVPLTPDFELFFSPGSFYPRGEPRQVPALLLRCRCETAKPSGGERFVTSSQISPQFFYRISTGHFFLVKDRTGKKEKRVALSPASGESRGLFFLQIPGPAERAPFPWCINPHTNPATPGRTAPRFT